MWWIFLLVSASRADDEDLVAMAKHYGLASVAAVVQSAAGGGISLSEAHATLRKLGLAKISMPVTVSPELPTLQGAGPISNCGYNQGIACSMPIPAGAGRTRFVVRCMQRKRPLEIDVTYVVEPEPTADTPGTAHLQDLLPCWSAGADSVRLIVPPPEP